MPKRVFAKEQLEMIKSKGLNVETVRKRIKKGMSFEEALNMPLWNHVNAVLTREQVKEVKSKGFLLSTIRMRIRKGMSYEEAISTPLLRKKISSTLTKEQWLIAKENGLSSITVHNRINRLGWDIEKAISKPVKPKRKLTSEQIEKIKEKGFKCATIRSRMEKGMSFEEAINTPLKHNRLTPEQKKKAIENGISVQTAYSRKLSGWTTEEAITIPINSHHFFTKEELSIAAANGVSKSMLQNRFYTLGWTIEEAINTPKHGKYGKGDRWTR